MPTKLIKMKCPHCNQEFTMEDLYNHNKIQFDDFIENRVEEESKERRKREEKEIRKELENHFLNEINKKQTEFASEKEKLAAEVLKERLEKENLIKTQTTLIKEKENELKINYRDEIETLKTKLLEKENVLTKTVGDLKVQFETEKQKLIEVATLPLQKEIKALTEENIKNRIIQNKTKGENFEVEIANELWKAFDRDAISKITVGDKKADFLQVVKKDNREIGRIVYEVKNAVWSDAWVPKLVSDAANQKSSYGILVATSFNDKFPGDISFKQSDEYPNIWICNPFSFIFVAQIIRRLIEVEFSYNLKKQNFLDSEKREESLKKYIKQIEDLKVYLKNEVPDFLKTFNKQLADLTGVKNSLLKNATKLEKVHDMLRKKFDRSIKNRLEEIAETKIIEADESLGELDSEKINDLN